MKKYTLTCNCYDPPKRADITVEAESIADAWGKAKRCFSRRYRVKQSDVNITATHRHDAE